MLYCRAGLFNLDNGSKSILLAPLASGTVRCVNFKRCWLQSRVLAFNALSRGCFSTWEGICFTPCLWYQLSTQPRAAELVTSMPNLFIPGVHWKDFFTRPTDLMLF